MRRTVFFGLAVALVAGAACGPAKAAGDDTVRVSLNADIRSTTPGTNRDDNTDAVVLHVVEGLVAYRENGSVGPLLAESVEISPDGKTYTFHLRSGVKFHNGATMTADDVLWSWNRYMDPATEWRCLSEFDGRGRAKVEAIEAPDPQTVVVRLDAPNALFLSTLARPDCGMTGILHKDSVAADGSWIGPVGTGPYMLADWRRGEAITLRRFADYASLPGDADGFTGGKSPKVETVEFLVIPDASAAKAALVSGAIDLVPDISPADREELKDNPDIEIVAAETMGLNAILFQTRDPLMGNQKLRQAIAASLDTAQIVHAVTDGNSVPNNSVVPTASAYYTDVQRQGFTYDPARAQALLQEAGYAGEKIVMLTNNRYQSSFNTAVFAQAMMQAVGINVELEVLEWGTQLDRYSSGNYQMMAFPYSARLDPSLSFESMMGNKDEQPRKVWEDPEALELLARSMVVTDDAERQKIFDELHRRLIDQVPMIMLFNGSDLAAFNSRIEGYRPWAASKPRLWTVSIAG